MDQPKYHIDIFWSDEDGGYIANVPDLRYCSAFGESYEEALREVLVAMELHLDTLRELNRPIPEPGARRVIGVRADLSESGDTIQIVGRASVSGEENVGDVAGRVADAVSQIAETVGGEEIVVSDLEVIEGAGQAVEDIGEGAGQVVGGYLLEYDEDESARATRRSERSDS